jgi:hypothetical protein
MVKGGATQVNVIIGLKAGGESYFSVNNGKLFYKFD